MLVNIALVLLKLICTRDSVGCEVLGIAPVQHHQRQSISWIYKRGHASPRLNPSCSNTEDVSEIKFDAYQSDPILVCPRIFMVVKLI